MSEKVRTVLYGVGWFLLICALLWFFGPPHRHHHRYYETPADRVMEQIFGAPDKPTGTVGGFRGESAANNAAPSGDALNEEYGVAIEKGSFMFALLGADMPAIQITYSFTNPYDFEIALNEIPSLRAVQDTVELDPVPDWAENMREDIKRSGEQFETMLEEAKAAGAELEGLGLEVTESDASDTPADPPVIAPGERVEVTQSFYLHSTTQNVEVSCIALDHTSLESVVVATRVFPIKEHYAAWIRDKKDEWWVNEF